MPLKTRYKGTAKMATSIVLSNATMRRDAIFWSEAMIPNNKKPMPITGRQKNKIHAENGHLLEWLPCDVQINTGSINMRPPKVRWNDL